MQIQGRSQIIKVKEKESFTNNRENEPAMSGTFYFKSGRLLEAQDLTTQLISENPNVTFLYNLMGVILAEQNKFKEALEYYEKGIKIDPAATAEACEPREHHSTQSRLVLRRTIRPDQAALGHSEHNDPRPPQTRRT